MKIFHRYRILLLSMMCLGLLLTAVPSAFASTSSGKLTCPRITGFTPHSGVPGTSVTITGCGFTGTSSVTFHGVVATFTVNSDTSITATVPTGALSGLIAVTTPTKTVKSASKFTVPPSVTLSPTAGPPGSMVSVSGANFSSSEAVDIYFDTTDEALAASNGQGQFSGISIPVPASALPGTHWVTAVGRHSGLSAQTSFMVQTNWAQFHDNDQLTGINHTENVLNISNAGNLDVSWTGATGGVVMSSPAIANGVAYVGSEDGKLYAFNAQTGALLWSAATGSIIESSPAVANGVVYVGSVDGNLYAFNAQTGTQVWSAPVGFATVASPTVADGIVYIGSDDDNLYAFNATTGSSLWSATTGGEIISAPAVTNGVAYATSENGTVYAYNAATGSLLWNASLGIGNSIQASPAVTNGVVYVNSTDDSLYALNATTGSLLWSAATGSYIVSSPAVANGVVYVGSEDHNLYAFNSTTGKLLWSAVTGSAITYSSPAVANGVVYTGSEDNNLYAYNAATGALLWSSVTGSAIDSSPAVANGMVYIGSNDGSLHAYALPGNEQFRPMGRLNPATLHPNLKLHLQR